VEKLENVKEIDYIERFAWLTRVKNVFLEENGGISWKNNLFLIYLSPTLHGLEILRLIIAKALVTQHFDRQYCK
jgi:hypothetical protein